jgi:DNA-binding XRE family transcriptional regulator
MILTCVSYGLRQFVLRSDLCRRCRAPLGSSVHEIALTQNRSSTRHKNQLALSFGLALRSMRLRQGRTEVQIAQAAGVERSHLSRIERNQVTPNLETALRILRGLGVESIFVYLPRK